MPAGRFIFVALALVVALCTYAPASAQKSAVNDCAGYSGELWERKPAGAAEGVVVVVIELNCRFTVDYITRCDPAFDHLALVAQRNLEELGEVCRYRIASGWLPRPQPASEVESQALPQAGRQQPQ